MKFPKNYKFLFHQDTNSFYLVIDNLNGQKKANNQTTDNPNKRFDIVHVIAAENRVTDNSLDNTRAQKSVCHLPNVEWFLSEQEYQNLIRYPAIEKIKEIMCRHMLFFKEIDHEVKKRIPHKFSEEMKQKSNIVSFLILTVGV